MAGAQAESKTPRAPEFLADKEKAIESLRDNTQKLISLEQGGKKSPPRESF